MYKDMRYYKFYKTLTSSLFCRNKFYICSIILKGCLALSDQTERQAEIIPIVVVETQCIASLRETTDT